MVCWESAKGTRCVGESTLGHPRSTSSQPKVVWQAHCRRADGYAPIQLFAIWAHVDSPAEYIEQVHLLLDIIERTPVPSNAVMAGDLNSNAKWDRDYGSKSHCVAVERLLKLGFKSAYHEFFKCLQGAEEHPTFWLTKNKNRSYHTDYIFLSRSLSPKCKKVELGACDEWLGFSDHAPLLVELDA